VALAAKTTKAPAMQGFRGSIAWLSGSLSTHHDVGRPSPRKTRSQVLVKLSWTGFHPQGSDNKFQSHFVCAILLFQTSWHNLASLPGVRSGDCSPVSPVLSRHCDSCRPSHRTSFPSFGGTTGMRPFRSRHRGRMADDEPGVFHPVAPTGNSSVETTGSPKFLGNLNSRLLMFFDPGRPNVPDLDGTFAWPSLKERRRRQRRMRFEAH